MKVRNVVYKRSRGGVVLGVLGVLALLGSLASAAPEHKTYTADITPHTVAAGASENFTATLVNTSTQQQLGSADITPPPGFTLTAVVSQPEVDGAPQGTAVVDQNVLQLRDLSAPPEATVTVTFTAEVPCTADPGIEWEITAKQANDFHGPPGNDLTLDTESSDLSVTVVGSCRLNFFEQPADAAHDAVISSQAFEPTGTPIQVEILDGKDNRVSSSAAITIELDKDPDTTSATLSGTTTRTAVNGLAFFDDLSIDLFDVRYTLVASSSGLDPAASDPFDIWEEVVACQAGQPCQNSVGGSQTTATARTTSATAGFLPMSFDVVKLDCGDTANHAAAVTTIDSVGLTGTKTVTITVSKEFDQLQPNNGVAHYQICYQSDTPFTDRFGSTTTLGLLPDCKPSSPTAPCVVSKTKDKAGNVILEVLLPEGDPNFW